MSNNQETLPASTSNRNPLLVVLSAPSGAGKTTLGQQLLAARPGFTRVVTCTTRAPREGERDGVDYHFLSREAFEQRIAEGAFLEHARVYDQFYGTLASEVTHQLESGRDVLLTLDVQGVRTLRRVAGPDPRMSQALVTVFLTPATLAELEQRLRRRNQNRPDDMERRLAEARREIARWPEYDYLIFSTSVAEDARRMLAIVDAEAMRPFRSTPPIL